MSSCRGTSRVAALLLLVLSQAHAQKTTPGHTQRNWVVRPEWVRAHEELLASDALEGRGSGTRDEWITATYIGSELREYGVAPAGDDLSYVQKVELEQEVLTAAPVLKAGTNPETTFEFGKDFRVFRLSGKSLSGPLQKIDLEKQATPPEIKKGAIVLATLPADTSARRTAFRQTLQFIRSGAAAVLIPEAAQTSTQSSELPKLAPRIKGIPAGEEMELNVLTLTPDAAGKLSALPEDSTVSFVTTTKPAEPQFTYNAVGIIQGSDPQLKSQAILLSAHLDHLGIGKAVNGDSIYNGADDDASGVTAVLELARALAAGPKPRRTVLFALFGSEETGRGYGAVYYREKPPVPLMDIAANLEFEMIGRPDPKVQPEQLWLTGWERSSLGPELASHGAKLVPDPHPEENFFARSDNYALALKGVVAQTVSSFGLHSDYHRPSDDIAHLDFAHMTAAIQSLVEPIRWLANSDFKPQWKAGKQP
jgi:aminopeptidase YwaD